MTGKNSRPLSPHLQIYRLPLLPLLSITHRVTGVLLALVAFLLPFILLALASSPAGYNKIHQHLSAWYGQLFLFGVSLALVYHFLNGIRHLIWDTGHNLSVRGAEFSAYILLLLTPLLTAIIWFWVWCG